MENNTLTLTEQKKTELVSDSERFLSQYKDFTIATNEEYTGTADILRKIKSKSSELEELRKSMTRPIDEAKKKIQDFFKGPLNNLSQAEAWIKRAILGYQQAQERIMAAEQAKLQEAARKEEERKRKAIEKQIEAAKAAGKLEKVEKLQEKKEAVSVPVAQVQNNTPKVEGLSTKKLWKFKIVDANLIPRDYLTPDEKKIQAVATATKGTLSIPGVEIYSEDNLSSRR